MVSPETGHHLKAATGELLNTFVTHHRSQFPLLIRVTDWKEETSVLENHFVRPGVELVIHGWTRQTKVLARAAGVHYAVPLTYGGLFRPRSRVFSGAIQLWNARPKSRLRVIRVDPGDPSSLAVGDVVRLRRNQDDDWSTETGGNGRFVRETKKFLRCERLVPAPASSSSSPSSSSGSGQFVDLRVPLSCSARFEEILDEAPANPEAVSVRELVKTLALRDVEVDLVSPSPDRPSRDRDLPEKTPIVLSDNATEQAIYVSVESPNAPAFHLPLRTLVYVVLVQRLDKQCSPLLTKQAPKLSTLDRCVEILPAEVFDSLRPLQRSFESPDITEEPSSHKSTRRSEDSQDSDFRQQGSLAISIKSREHGKQKHAPPTQTKSKNHQASYGTGAADGFASLGQRQRHSRSSSSAFDAHQLQSVGTSATESVDSSPHNSSFKPSDTSSQSSFPDSRGAGNSVTVDRAISDEAYPPMHLQSATMPVESYHNYLGHALQFQTQNQIQGQGLQPIVQTPQPTMILTQQPQFIQPQQMLTQQQLQAAQLQLQQLQLDQTQLLSQGQVIQPQIQLTQPQMQAAQLQLQLLQPLLQQQMSGVQLPQFVQTPTQTFQPQVRLIQPQNFLSNEPQIQSVQPQLHLSQPQMHFSQGQMQLTAPQQQQQLQPPASFNHHSATLALAADQTLAKSTKKNRAPAIPSRPSSIQVSVSPTTPQNITYEPQPRANQQQQQFARGQVEVIASKPKRVAPTNASNHVHQTLPPEVSVRSTARSPRDSQDQLTRNPGSQDALQQQQALPMEIPPGFGIIQLQSSDGFNIPPGFALVPLGVSPTATTASAQAPTATAKQVTFSQTGDDDESTDDDVMPDPEAVERKIAAFKVKIPNDGNLYNLSSKKFQDVLSQLRLEPDAMKTAKKSNLDGKKFSNLTEEELVVRSLGNPVLLHFKRLSGKNQRKSFVF